jgi:hypothetical protein
MESVELRDGPAFPPGFNPPQQMMQYPGIQGMSQGYPAQGRGLYKPDQLWRIAFSKMLGGDSTKYNFLQLASKAFIADKGLSDAPSDEDVALIEVERLQDTLEQVISRFGFSQNLASSSILRSLARILEILNVVQNTVGFNTGAFAWLCISTAVKVCPNPSRT